MKVNFFAVLMLASFIGYGQSPKVPAKMSFAGMKLRITEAARREIQKDVDALTKYPKYYEIKAERARSYFPIIERVFREENLPEDFKYLVLQESALIPDAVSSSNAVGFWQFKDFTAAEVGLKINRNVDERMNIVSSSRGAARYLKKNNNAFFDNWLYSLQAYQSGPGAALKVLDQKNRGAKSMVIDKKTYWYVKKYLAHKVAFENLGNKEPNIYLAEYYDGANKSLKDISKEKGVDENELLEYNKWLRKGKIPGDKSYAIIIPTAVADYADLVADADTAPLQSKKAYEPHDFKSESNFPKIQDRDEAIEGGIVSINDLPGIMASSKDRIPQLAKKGNLKLSKFLKYNDLQIDSKLTSGQVYYLKPKRNKAKTHYHVVNHDETLWDISQKYGIKLKKLRAKNRMTSNETIKPGRVLWLRYIRPADTEIEYKQLPQLDSEKLITDSSQNTPLNSEEEKVTDIEATPTPIVEDYPEESDVELDAMLDSLNALEAEMEAKDSLLRASKGIEEKEAIEEKLEEEYDPKVGNTESINNEENENVRKEKPFTKPTVIEHIIEAGQTYYAVSKIYDVEVMKIIEWNDLDISDKLSIGQKLIIHKELIIEKENLQSTDEEAFSYHVVKEGEGLYGIARSYNVTIQDVMDWNKKENFDISVGEKLKIKKKSNSGE